MEAIPIIVDESSYAFFDYIKTSFPLAFIGTGIFTVVYILLYFVNVRHDKWLMDEIQNFK